VPNNGMFAIFYIDPKGLQIVVGTNALHSEKQYVLLAKTHTFKTQDKTYCCDDFMYFRETVLIFHLFQLFQEPKCA
jgi:hypothetical protein